MTVSIKSGPVKEQWWTGDRRVLWAGQQRRLNGQATEAKTAEEFRILNDFMYHVEEKTDFKDNFL